MQMNTQGIASVVRIYFIKLSEIENKKKKSNRGGRKYRNLHAISWGAKHQIDLCVLHWEKWV